jgi:hypothetical protein
MCEKDFVVKGHGVEREQFNKSAVDQDVNFHDRPAAMLSGTLCQSYVDTKALTGRGNRCDLRKLKDEVDRLEKHMAELAETSKKVPGAQIYLMLHRRSTGYLFLRWREVLEGKRHLSWDKARVIYMANIDQISAWYIEITDRAIQANEEHKALRKEIRELTKRVLIKPMHIFTRSKS